VARRGVRPTYACYVQPAAISFLTQRAMRKGGPEPLSNPEPPRRARHGLGSSRPWIVPIRANPPKATWHRFCYGDHRSPTTALARGWSPAGGATPAIRPEKEGKQAGRKKFERRAAIPTGEQRRVASFLYGTSRQHSGRNGSHN
jgi:hypothetical protein